MRDSVPSARYSSVCNVLRQWRTWLILIIESTDSMITFGNLASFPSYVFLPCAYDIYYDYAVLLLISLLLHALINATCAGTRLYR